MPNFTHWNISTVWSKNVILFNANGCIFNIKWSYTIKNQENLWEVPFPFLKGKLTCPTSAPLNFYHMIDPLWSTTPALAYSRPDGPLTTPNSASIRSHLQCFLPHIGLNPADYNTRSFQRRCACHFLVSCMLLEAFKTLGDWTSDSIFDYLKPDTSQKMTLDLKEVLKYIINKSTILQTSSLNVEECFLIVLSKLWVHPMF